MCNIKCPTIKIKENRKKMYKLKFSVLVAIIPIILLTSIFSGVKKDLKFKQTEPPFMKYSSQWVDSTLRNMSLDEKIGQLFMVAVYPKAKDQSKIIHLIEEYNIGGIIYFKGSPTKVAELTNRFQKLSKTPMLVAIDGEWGVGMRLDSVMDFPHQMMLGALKDNKLIYEMGAEIANQCKILGINIDFAPVVDINNNPMNPVIGVRSFGENKINVSQKGYAYMLGLQDNNILAVAKHFPGHGDTGVDSHKDLPIISASKKRLDTLELFPFKHLISAGVGGVMVAHLDIPALDKTPHLPSTLSPKVVEDLLVKKLGFKGLIFTDALGMQGVAKYYGAGEAEIRALLAGNDVLLMSQNVPLAFNKIKLAVQSGKISEKIINQKVRKILKAKYWLGVSKFKKLNTKNIVKRINTPNAEKIKRDLVKNALTIVKNNNELLPFEDLKNAKYACVSIGNGTKTAFDDYLSRYTKIDNFDIDKSATASDFLKLQKKLANYDYIIIGLLKTNQYSIKTYGITQNSINFIENLAQTKSVVLDLFGNAYALNRFSKLDKIRAIVISYEEDKITQELSAQLLFGGIAAKGHLPVSLNSFKIGTGEVTSKFRLGYTIPEELNIDSRRLDVIDSIVYTAIGDKAFPGCQIMAIKNGEVFYQKSFGYHTYKFKNHVKWNDVYDLASITKVTATTLALMRLYDEGKFKVNALMSDYLPELDTTNKKDMRIIDVLTHQARLQPWIPFFKMAMNANGTWNTEYISRKKTDKFDIQIAKNLYTDKEFDKKVYERIYESKLLRRKRYRYSDLGFYLFKKIIEDQTGESLDKYVENNFYESLGAYTTGYNPLERGINLSRIPPTEYDYRFRKQLVDGHVHDYGAAVLGGVGGHAGLFSSANDLAKLLQMYLQKGQYAGIRYIKASTIKLFTTKPFSNSRRALGFDSTNGFGEGPACSLASYSSFGHTGFTGGIIWVDPKYDFIYIFLSNRVYPSIENKRIIEMNVREKIQSIFYQSFLYYSK